jgi:hypothetical protein
MAKQYFLIKNIVEPYTYIEATLENYMDMTEFLYRLIDENGETSESRGVMDWESFDMGLYCGDITEVTKDEILLLKVK